MRKLSILITMALLFSVLNACTAGFSRYLYDRFADAADIGRVSVGLGPPGLSADMQMTSYFRGAFGSYQDQNKLGMQGRRAGYWVESKSILAFGKVFQFYYRQKNVIGNIQDTNIELLQLLSGAPKRQKLAPPWLIDVNVYVFIAGAEAGMDPYEIFDFIFGWLTIDIANDDILRRPDPGKTYMKKLRQTGYGKKSPPKPPVPSFNKGISPIPDPPYLDRNPFRNKKKQFRSTHGGKGEKYMWKDADLDF